MFHALVLAAATATPANAARPIRSVTFSFHMDGESYGGYDMIDDDVQGGYDGTIRIDVMATGSQGALFLRIEQHVPLYHQVDVGAAECVVYPGGQVTFDPNLAHFSTPELTLARFLARNFIDTGLIDAQNHWKLELQSHAVDAVSNFTIVKNENGVLSIDESRDLNDTSSKTHTTGTLKYDLNRTIPLTISEDSITRGNGATTRMRLEYSLSSDSMAPRP